MAIVITQQSPRTEALTAVERAVAARARGKAPIVFSSVAIGAALGVLAARDETAAQAVGAAAGGALAAFLVMLFTA